MDECYIGGSEEGKPGRSKGQKALVVIAVEIVRCIGRKLGSNVTQYDIEGPPERQKRSQLMVSPASASALDAYACPSSPMPAQKSCCPGSDQTSRMEPRPTLTDGRDNGLDTLGFSHIRTLQTQKEHNPTFCHITS